MTWDHGGKRTPWRKALPRDRESRRLLFTRPASASVSPMRVSDRVCARGRRADEIASIVIKGQKAPTPFAVKLLE
jgi:hypothetical protein